MPPSEPSAPWGRRARVPQQARSRRTRERLLEAAVACFEEEGFDETTTAGIARRAGVAVGTLYAWFPDKRELLLEVMARALDPIVEPVLRGLDPARWRSGSLHEHMRSLIESVFKARTVSPGLQRILWGRYFKDPEFRSAFEAVGDRIREALADLLRVLRDEGRARIDDVDTAARVIHSSIEWTAARLMLAEAPDAEIDAAVEATSDMVSRFLFP